MAVLKIVNWTPWSGAAARGLRSKQLRLGKAGLYAAWVLIAAAVEVAAAEQPSLEYQVKASYIYNLIQFIDWPQDMDKAHSERFTICVSGVNRFGIALDLLNGKTAKGKTIAVRYLHADTDAAGCQVVFVSASQARRQTHILKAVAGPGVLTIGETAGFIADGGIINFIKVNDKIRFEINNDSARRAGLNISAQLLNLASRK